VRVSYCQKNQKMIKNGEKRKKGVYEKPESEG
jgi:hypothetical protein